MEVKNSCLVNFKEVRTQTCLLINCFGFFLETRPRTPDVHNTSYQKSNTFGQNTAGQKSKLDIF